MFRALCSRLTGKRLSKPAAAATGALFRAPLAPDWQPEYQRELNIFLRTDTGVVLLERMRAVEAAVAARACQEPFHVEHSSGRAAGFADARAWLESLSRVARDSATPESEPANSEMHTQGTGESSLRERLSP